MKKGILLVDDDQDILAIFKKILKEEGYTVYTGCSSEQAKTMINEHEVNLVIMDYFLKKTNGVQLAEALKKIDEKLQIVFLTGYHPILDTVEGLGFQVERVLLKPVDIKDLLREIRNVFAKDSEAHRAPIPIETIVSGIY